MPFKLHLPTIPKICVFVVCVSLTIIFISFPVFRTEKTTTVSYSKVLELFCRKHHKMFAMHFKFFANKTFPSHHSFYGSFCKIHCCRKLELTSATSKHFLAEIALKNLITHFLRGALKFSL